MSLAGNPRWLKRHQAQCTRQDEKLYVRCCSSSGAKVQMYILVLIWHFGILVVSV